MTWDVICFSHLRWNFVYQRPQHLMSRVARKHRVFFVEEPILGDRVNLEIHERQNNLWVITPHLPHEMSEEDRRDHQVDFLSQIMKTMEIDQYITWFYSPMALAIGEQLSPLAIVYDCMDELSAFKFAPPALRSLEFQLMDMADVVFTGGHSLYEAKKAYHSNIHSFPSSIDFDHFFKARSAMDEPEDQNAIPQPRIGFCGVIDERMDLELVREIAERRQNWHIVMIGPVAKIDPNSLPLLDNIHYLGMKQYESLPNYFAGWDVAIMPFAISEATRFISPTKTPEYLAAGLPVVSTPIHDVVRQYSSVVSFGCTSGDFISAVERNLDHGNVSLRRVDEILSENSWDRTWRKMEKIIHKAVDRSNLRPTIKSSDVCLTI